MKFTEFKKTQPDVDDQDLFEIKMSPKNLRAEAEKTGALAGMEFEMIVPDVGTTNDEPEYEADYDYDRRGRSFSDIEDFFFDGDYNGRGDIRRLMESLREDYMNWKMEKTADDWADDGLDFMRDWIADNDLFDRDEALDTVRDSVMDAFPDLDPESEEFQKLVREKLDELEEEFVESEYESQGRIYNDAFETFSDMKNEEYDEGDFIQETVPYMTDVQSNYDIAWPYYIDTNEGGGEANVDAVAEDFSDYLNKPVNASSSYHGARREPGRYVVEPDGSLDPDNAGDAGLEFVSPPMPIKELLADLTAVKQWADNRGCYTNKSTGLHINISVPGYSQDKLDFVKLALLMGDEYVLNQFGRSSNTYASSAMGKIKEIIKQNPDKAKDVLEKMRGHMEGFATKAIHSGHTSKYTSINTKDGYIEFRSPGGDWLNENFDKVENTLMRFTVAMAAAINPEAYREEYLKKLYKLLEPAREVAGVDTIKFFSDYVAGKMPKAALRSFIKQAQLQRQAIKGRAPSGQKYWWNVQWDANRRMEVVAGNKQVAKQVAAEEWGVPESQLAGAVVTMLRPYEEPQTARSSEPIPGSTLDRARQRAAASGQQTGTHTYRAFDFRNNQTLGTFQGGEPGSDSAAEAFADMLAREGISAQYADYELIGQERQRSTQSASSEAPVWYVSIIGRPGSEVQVRARSHDEAVTAATQMRRDIFGNEQGNIRASTVPVRQAGQQQDNWSQDFERRMQQPAQSTGGFTGTWIIKGPDGRELHRFSGIGNSQADANNFAIRWLRSNPEHLRTGVEVVPEMS